MSLLRAIKRSPLALESNILFQGFDPNFTDSDLMVKRFSGVAIIQSDLAVFGKVGLL